MKTEKITTSAAQTRKLGELLAAEILKTENRKEAIIVGLDGNLGSGKTTFTQGFAKGLGIRKKILSPTFVIVKRFDISSGFFSDLYHIDCYRVENGKCLSDLGFKEIIANPEHVVVIEWVKRIRRILPKKIILIDFMHVERNKRKIVIRY